jgi:hypothetical protein
VLVDFVVQPLSQQPMARTAMLLAAFVFAAIIVVVNGQSSINIRRYDDAFCATVTGTQEFAEAVCTPMGSNFIMVNLASLQSTHVMWPHTHTPTFVNLSLIKTHKYKHMIICICMCCHM